MKKMNQALLSVEKLDVAYGSAKVLHNISISIGTGEMVFLVGRNGAGKTTLLKTISGFLKPRDGSILFNGKNINALSIEQAYSEGIRYVFQDKRVFSELTVKENIAIAAYGAKEKLSDALDKMFLIYPKLKDFINIRAKGLSGGQKQLLLIGRALIGNPSLILIDEPTEGLAAGTIEDIFKVLAMLQGKISLLIVEQNLSVVCRLAHRVYTMEEGKITHEFTQDQLKDQSQLEACL